MGESVSESEIKVVKEALGAGQQLLQKLYTELDKEREASATAASEALSMILRLQEEKAAMKMEASQYQRMAEEQISHAEDYLAGFEDMIYQKEMEVASLEFQVESYRYKLLNLGCPDLGPCEPRFADKVLVQNKELGGSNGETKVRRAKSLPPSQVDERDAAEMVEAFEIHKLDCCPSTVRHPNRCSWEQIEMLDEQIKEISDPKGSGEDRFECLNGGIAICPSSIQDKPGVSPKCSSSLSSVHDIFEIPEANKQNLTLKTCQAKIQLQKKLIFEGENRLGKPDPLPIEPFRLYYEHEQKTKAKNGSSCKTLKNKSSKSRKGKAIEQIDEIVAESQPFQQLCRVINQLEQNRGSIRQEISSAGAEEMRLLQEIQKQLTSIQSEMRSFKLNQQRALHGSMFDLLQEVLAYSPFLCH